MFKSTGEPNRMLKVERPVREIIKLLNVEDKSLFQKIENARNICREIIEARYFLCAIDHFVPAPHHQKAKS